MLLNEFVERATELLAEHGDIPVQVAVTVGPSSWRLLGVHDLTVSAPKGIDSDRQHRQPKLFVETALIVGPITPSS